MVTLALKLLVSYLMGSVSGSLFLGRLKGVDIREHGSGNAGGTNALRTQGALFALGVIVIDIGKGVLAAAVVGPYAGGGATAILLCGVAAVLGHCYPVFYGFRGGKGAATLVGVYGALHWPLLIPVFLIWLGVVLVSGYVGLATMVASAAALGYRLITGQPALPGALVFFAAMVVFTVYTHRSNVARMLAGNENRNKLWLFGPRS